RVSALRRPFRVRRAGGDGPAAPTGHTRRGPATAPRGGTGIPPSRRPRGLRGGAAGGERPAHGSPQPTRVRARAEPAREQSPADAALYAAKQGGRNRVEQAQGDVTRYTG